MPSFKDKLIWNLKKIFHRPTVQIGKANVLLYMSIILIFVIALIFRLFPVLKYVSELRALDPYVQFKAAQYIVDNGIVAYFNWYEMMTWAPGGVAMGPYLYLGTPLSGVFFYYIFNFLGFNITIYDTCVITPAIVGALACIAMYFLGKELAGNKKTGVLAAFLLAICVGFQSRTIAGFYDNEAVGLFGLIVFFFFFIKALKTSSIPYAVFSGFGLSILSLSWGAYQYVWDLLPLSVLLLLLLKKYSPRLLMVYTITFFITLLSTIVQPTTGWRELLGTEALINFGIIGLCLLIEIYRRFKETAIYDFIKLHWKGLLRISLLGLLVVLIVTSITGSLQSFLTTVSQGIPMYGGRYLAVLFPWTPGFVVQSVAEHAPASWALFYYNYEFILFLFPLGLYFLFKRLYEEDVFIIVFGLTTVYFSSSMSRLQMIFAPAACLIAAFGLVSLIKPFSLVMRKKFLTVRRRKRMTSIVTREISVAIFSLMFFFLLFTSIHGTYNAAYQIQPGMANDFRETFAWMRANLPSTSVVVSWWDYGYQTTTVGEVTTVVDNGTWNNTAMGMVGRMFMATDELESVEILENEWNADYVLVSWSYFYPNGGGDEGKWQWMIRIANETIGHTKYQINIEDRWNETSYKPTCEFFDTTLWKMLTYGEPFIDSATDEGLIEGLLQNGYPLGYFEARLNWADPWIPGSRTESGQWKDDSGHLWKYHNPALGAGMGEDGVVDYDQNGDDDTVGQFLNLKYFTHAFISAGHLVKVFKVEHERADLRAEITDDTHLYNNSVATITLNNNGVSNLVIQSVSINGKTVESYAIAGTKSLVMPGEQVILKAYGPELPIGDIVVNETEYDIDVTVKDNKGFAYTATKKCLAEPAPYINMTIEESQIHPYTNDTILVPVTNIGADLLQIASVEVDNVSISDFGIHTSSLGENVIDITCNFTQTGFSTPNVTALRGDLINFHITNNLTPGSIIKFGVTEFEEEILINYGQTGILPVLADRNGTFPYYCYNVLWPPGDYTVGNLTINYSEIVDQWNYKFIQQDQNQTLYVHLTRDLHPDELINLTISTNPNENISRSFTDLRVTSPTSCLLLENVTAYANETIYLKMKNVGAYDEIIDHIWLNNEIFDMYSLPKPQGLSLEKNESIELNLEFPSSILNLNITSPYDPIPLQANLSLKLGSRTMDPESQHAPSIEVINDYNAYNISISDEIYSNETLIVNVKNIGSQQIEVSDFRINNVSTSTFSVSGNGSSVIDSGDNQTFSVTSNLNLNYLDSAQIMVRTYEGPYRIITRTVNSSGKIDIAWSKAYQNNGTIYLNITNTESSPVTIKSIYAESIGSLAFNPVDSSLKTLSSAYNKILGNTSQLFRATMAPYQSLLIDENIPLSITVTTYEGASVEHNATWAWEIRINHVFAFVNNTVNIQIQNTGYNPTTINQINLNSTATSFNIINGSATLNPGEISILGLTSASPLLFGNTLEVEAIANYTLMSFNGTTYISSPMNFSDSYHVPFILYNGPNITIIEGWPTVAYDNSSLPGNNDTVFIKIMNTGNISFEITQFLLYNGTTFIPHQFNTTTNQSIMSLAPYQLVTYVNRSIAFNISADYNNFLTVNITTNVLIDATHNLSIAASILILHDQPNITIVDDNSTTIALYYTIPVPQTLINVNITNYGDTVLSINLQTDITLNVTVTTQDSGIISLNPGESYNLQITILGSSPSPGDFIKIIVNAHYDSSVVTDELIIQVYAG